MEWYSWFQLYDVTFIVLSDDVSIWNICGAGVDNYIIHLCMRWGCGAGEAPGQWSDPSPGLLRGGAVNLEIPPSPNTHAHIIVHGHNAKSALLKLGYQLGSLAVSSYEIVHHSKQLNSCFMNILAGNGSRLSTCNLPRLNPSSLYRTNTDARPGHKNLTISLRTHHPAITMPMEIVSIWLITHINAWSLSNVIHT